MNLFSQNFSAVDSSETAQPKNLISIGDISVLSVSPTAAIDELQTAPASSGCGGNCSCNHTPTPLAADPTFDSTGIQAMMKQMVQSMAPEMDATEVQELTDSLEWDRLDHIVQLSTQGDGWDDDVAKESLKSGLDQFLNHKVDRRTFIKIVATGLLSGLGLLMVSCGPLSTAENKESAELNWKEYFKGNFRLMSDNEKEETVTRLERLHQINTGQSVTISTAGPQPGVLYGYAFNISKCQGYMDCISACLAENNQDRKSDMRYIRIHEHKQGEMNFAEAEENFSHQVPAADHFYVGTQCFHCENPPCVPVCPVKATWKEDDGIVVVDYDWCIGCRYCIAACPYDARRFNWSEPEIPLTEVNQTQHYLGNRLRKQGVTEKCTFCIQRTRVGKNPACVEACPTGARVFGNLLDPNSEIRWVLKNKKVFRLKEDLGTEPKFWYFMD